MPIMNNAGGSTTGVTASSLLSALQAQSGTNPPPKNKKSSRRVRTKKNETLASIAEKNNVLYNELRGANPGVSSVYAGMNVNLPRLTGAQAGDNRASSSIGSFTSNPSAAEISAGGYIPGARPGGGISSPFDGVFNYERYAGIDAARRASSGRNISDTIPQPDVQAGFQRTGGDVSLADRNKLSTEELMKAYPPINIYPSGAARNLAGSQFNNDPVSAFEYSQQATDGVRRQGVLNIIENIARVDANGNPDPRFLQRISGLVAPTLFSELGSYEKDLMKEDPNYKFGSLMSLMSNIYDIDPLGNLIQKGTDSNATDSLSGFGGGGTFRRRGGGGGGRTYDPRSGGAGQNISTNMLSWRIATG